MFATLSICPVLIELQFMELIVLYRVGWHISIILYQCWLYVRNVCSDTTQGVQTVLVFPPCCRLFLVELVT
jgi:hypothetical protein